MLDAAQAEPESATDNLSTLDGRTGLAKRIRQLVGLFSDALGGVLTPLQAEAVQRAAELKAVAENLRRAHLRGEGVAFADLVKAENCAARAERALRIGKVASEPEPTPTLRQYAATRSAIPVSGPQAA